MWASGVAPVPWVLIQDVTVILSPSFSMPASHLSPAVPALGMVWFSSLFLPLALGLSLLYHLRGAWGPSLSLDVAVGLLLGAACSSAPAPAALAPLAHPAPCPPFPPSLLFFPRLSLPACLSELLPAADRLCCPTLLLPPVRISVCHLSPSLLVLSVFVCSLCLCLSISTRSVCACSSPSRCLSHCLPCTCPSFPSSPRSSAFLRLLASMHVVSSADASASVSWFLLRRENLLVQPCLWVGQPVVLCASRLLCLRLGWGSRMESYVIHR